MKYSLCIEPVFEDRTFYDRILLAKDLGLDAVEFWDPSVYDTKQIGSVAARAGIPVAACCLNQAIHNTANRIAKPEYPFDNGGCRFLNFREVVQNLLTQAVNGARQPVGQA